MVFSFSVQLWILPTLRGYCGEKTLQEYNCDSRVVPGTWSRWSWAEPYRAMDMRHKRLAQSEEKKESLQDLFSSWPQLWCCWTHRVSPQHCSLAPVWDIAQGSPPALSVRWMSMTSPRTTDKLLHRPPPSEAFPLPAAEAQPWSEWELPGASLSAGPCRTSRHSGEQNKLPQDRMPLPHDTHNCLWVWSAGIRWCCVSRQLYKGLLLQNGETWRAQRQTGRESLPLVGSQLFSYSCAHSHTEVNFTPAQLETCEPCHFSKTGA